MSQPNYAVTPTSLGRVQPKPRGVYSAATAYGMLDIVRYGGDSYVATTATQGNPPTNAAYWMRMTDAQGPVDAAVARVDTAVAGADAAAARAVDGALVAETVIGGVQAAALLVSASRWRFYADGNPVTIVPAEGSDVRVVADKACTLMYGAQSVALVANTPVVVTAPGGEMALSATNGAFLSVAYNRDSMDVLDQLTVPVSAAGPVATIGGCVGGLPLGVTARCVAAQQGAGDASPENIRPILGKNAINITRTGENYLTSSLEVGTIGGLDGIPINATNRVRTKDFTLLTPGTYRVSYAGVDDTRLYMYDVSYTFLQSESSTAWNSGDLIFTVSSNRYMKLLWRYSNDGVIAVDSVKRPQINPNKEVSTCPAALPEAAYGLPEAQDEVDWARELWTKRTRLITLTGTESWSMHSTQWFYSGNLANFNGNFAINAICNQKTLLRLDAYVVGDYFKVGSAGIYLSQTQGITTVAGLKAYLAAQYAAGTPVQVLYAFATPQTITIPKLTIPSLPGQNTVFTDAGGDTAVAGRMGAAWMAARMDAMQQQITALQQLVTG